MISTITIDSLLPTVFDDIRHSEAVKASQVWLCRVEFVKGQTYLVYAESGTGKSSLCSFIYGARRDYEGRLLFDGRDASTFTPDDWSTLRCRGIAYLPQQLSLFPELTAIDNILIKNRLTDMFTEVEIREMLGRLGIADRADRPAGILSIGQQQRVAIVRALCQPFDFLLLDEPVSHLDARNNAVVAGLISEKASRQGASIIATSVGNNLSLNPTFTLHL